MGCFENFFDGFLAFNLRSSDRERSFGDLSSVSSVVCEVKCSVEDCAFRTSTYVGYTLNTVSKRLTYHFQHGSIKDHVRHSHNTVLTREDLENNVKIVKKLITKTRAQIYEALTILKRKPEINTQKDNFFNPLKLFSRTNFTSH